MSEHVQYKILPVQAAADLSDSTTRFKIATLGGTICSAALNQQAGGVIMTSARSGDTVSLAYEGWVKGMFGTAISTVGFPIKVANSGFLVAAASGDVTCGRAIKTCSSGDLATAFVDFKNIGYKVL